MENKEYIVKTIIHAGTKIINFVPGTKVFFHFKTTKCDPQRTIIDDSKVMGNPMELVLGKKFKLEVWEVIVQKMALNEVACFRIDKSLVTAYPFVSKTLREVGKPESKKRSHCCGVTLQNEGIGYDDLNELIKYPQDLEFTIDKYENLYKMKLVSKNVDKDGEGSVSLVPENTEDMWHAYNLISEGDFVTCSTIRKVQMESATGSSNSYRVRTTLTICVEGIDFDTQACVLRLKGRNVEENKYVKTGAYHTLDVEQNRKFTITKTKWDSISLERVDTACDPTQNADVAAVVMQEGIAHICLITSNMTIVRAKIDQVIPRKRKGNVSQHEKGLTRFYDNIMQGILRHVNFDIVKCIILASPGFVKDQFMDYMIQQAIKLDNKIILENKGKFLLVHSSSGFKHSLKEILAEPAVISRISETKASGEVKALETFYTILQTDPSRAFYGKKHIEKANGSQAIETLLISDKLFRCQDINLRKEYVELVESIKDSGGDVKIFSSLHVSGEQLDQLTGIAAILRFPMPELEDESDDESDSNEED
ncbi:protein pelota isoform X2 [Apis mellifera]|uniref:Protein pelota isoform X2 n=2 Tax=Apis mellifera TaxID=7460 RepID=A0A7M7L2C1_APIME|nr:protein pelota isoform X2 [Apis mellifera]|eukprot:XP_026295657.1 protein pelota isoform X2 [Apis mellifera]